jgi:hypothetical protein
MGYRSASTREYVAPRRLLGRRKSGFTTAVSDVEHSNNVSLNREQDSIEVRLPPVQEPPHFEVKLAILRGERATRGELRQRVYRFSETTKPGNRSIGGVLRTEPLKIASASLSTWADVSTR